MNWTKLRHPKSKWLKVGAAALGIALILSFGGIQVLAPQSAPELDGLQVGFGDKVITIGPEKVYAAGVADYSCDGADDDVQFQAALDALPAGGGKLVVLAGDYVFGATVLRAIDNVTIQGVGRSSYIAWNAGSSIFDAGAQSNWLFRDIRFDAGGVDVATATDWSFENVYIGATYYAYRVDSSITGDEFEVPTGRGATVIVAASNSRASGIAQADYVCDGTADDVEILAALTAAGSGVVLLLEGNYVTAANVAVPNDTTLKGMGFGTVITPTGAAIGGAQNGAIEMGGRSALMDMKVILAAGAGAGTTRPNVVMADTKTLVWIENVWIVGDTSPADDGTDLRQCGILFDTTTYSRIIDCRVEDNDRHGIQLGIGSNYNTVTGTTLEGNQYAGLFISASLHESASSNQCNSNELYGVQVFRSSYCTIADSICANQNTGDGIYVEGDGTTNSDYNTITGNVCYNNGDNGIEIAGGSDANKNLVSNNQLTGNSGTALVDAGVGTVHFEAGVDIFMDVLAVTANYVVDNEALDAGLPITFTIAAQPDVPRTLSGHFDTHAQITAYSITVTGTDAKGNTVTETFTEAVSAWDFETVNAYATVTSIIMTARTGTGAADTMDIGITDVLGLSDIIYATGDVYKIKKNTADAAVAGAQVSTVYDTYDMAVIGLAATDDFTIWFRSNLNVIG